MKTYIVLYRWNTPPLHPPEGFLCQADDMDHAEEQCLNAYPDCDIVWVWDGPTMADALDDYYCYKED